MIVQLYVFATQHHWSDKF